MRTHELKAGCVQSTSGADRAKAMDSVKGKRPTQGSSKKV